MYRFKTLMGEKLKSREFDRQANEVFIKMQTVEYDDCAKGLVMLIPNKENYLLIPLYATKPFRTINFTSFDNFHMSLS